MSRTSLTPYAYRPPVPVSLQPFPLNEGPQNRRVFIAQVVENPTTPENNLKGYIVYQRKGKHDHWEDITEETLNTAKNGQTIKFELDSDQTSKLFDALNEGYALANEGVYRNRKGLVAVDPNEAIVVAKDRKALIETLINQNHGEEIWKSLIELNPALSEKLSMAKMQANRRVALATFERALQNNSDEAFWQSFFENNTWIFGYGLNYQFLQQGTSQPIYSGANINGKGAQKGDFLLTTAADIRFTVLVEIKRADTSLFQYDKGHQLKTYRNGAPLLNDEMIGAVTQLQVNTHSWVTDGSRRSENQEMLQNEQIYTVQPKSILIIGHTHELDSLIKRNAFELYRQSIKHPEIITFDELFERAKYIVGHSDGIEAEVIESIDTDSNDQPTADSVTSFFDDSDLSF